MMPLSIPSVLLCVLYVYLRMRVGGMKCLGTAVLLSLVLLLPSSQAYSQACKNDELALQKSRGTQAALTQASNSFNGDCQDEAFEASLITSIPQPSQSLRDQRSECYRQGYQDGVTNWLAALSKRCDRGCFNNAAAVGEYGARLFCDAGSKDQSPASVGCFHADMHKCQDAFLKYVIANCPTKPGGEDWKRRYCSFPRNN